MNTTRLLAVIGLVVHSACLAQTADNWVLQGRAFLAAKNMTNANASFAAAVQKSPNHQTANVLYGTTRLLSLPYTQPWQEMMDRLGLPLTNRNIYKWTARLPHDTNGVPVPPNDFNSSELVAFARTNVLTEIDSTLGHLAKVSDPYFILNLTTNETAAAEVTVDYGDVQMLRSLLYASEFLIYSINSYNFNAQLNALYALKVRGEFTIERLLADYPLALTLADASDLSQAKQAFSSAVDNYLVASQFIRARPTNIVRLFNYDPDRADQETQFRQTLVELKASLVAPVVMTYVTNKTGHVTANLARAFDGSKPLRSLLPNFQNGGILLGSLPDPTLNGVLFGLSESDVYQLLGSRVQLLPNFRTVHRLQDGRLELDLNAADGRKYAIEASRDLVTWAQFAVAFSTNGVVTFFDKQNDQLPMRFYRARDLSDFASPMPLETAFVWAQKAGGLGNESGESLAVDSAGNCFIAGIPSGAPVTFSSTTTLTGTGNQDGFVTKYDTNGSVVWARQIGGDKTDNASGIAADTDGNCYVTGFFQGTTTFGPTTVVTNGPNSLSAYVAKFNRDGNPTWIRRSTESVGNVAQGMRISTDPAGNSYMVGYYNKSTTSFGAIVLTNTDSGGHLFVVKHDSEGNPLWAGQSGGSDRSFVSPTGIATDGAGNSYVTGQFFDLVEFGAVRLTSTAEAFDNFVAKFDVQGKALWASRCGSGNGPVVGGIAADKTGSCYVTGAFKGIMKLGTTTLTNSGSETDYDIFVTKYDTAGGVQWVRQAGGNYFDYGRGIVADNAGNSYVTGSFSGPANFSGTILNGNGVFVAKYDSSGRVLWAKKGQSDEAEGFGIALSRTGDIYVTGGFLGTAVFGATTLVNSGVVGKNGDIFVVKLSNPR